MTKFLSLLAALALTIGAASCGSSDEATDAGSDTTTADAGNATPADEPGSEETGDQMADSADVDTATMLPIMGEIEADAAAFTAGNVIVIRVNDLTVVDPDQALVSESTIEITDQTSPLPFEVVVDRAELDPTYKYSLRVIVTDADGTMLYTTNSANSFEAKVDAVDLGAVALIAAS